MFDELSGKLTATLQRLTGRGVLTEDAVKEGLREIRRILLEADVSFDLTREFLERVQARAVGSTALKDVRPGHQLVKIVYDELVALLGEKQAPIALRDGAADGHSAGRAAGLGQDHHRGQAGEAAQARAEGAVPGRGRRVSSRGHRAARDAGQAGATSACTSDAGVEGRGEDRQARASRRRRKARARTVIVDTAGRLQIDDEMMDELQAAQGRGHTRTRSCWSPTA